MAWYTDSSLCVYLVPGEVFGDMQGLQNTTSFIYLLFFSEDEIITNQADR